MLLLNTSVHDVAFIVPDPALFQLAEKIRKTSKIQFSLHEGLYDDAVDVAYNLVEKGARVLISRGETSTLLRNSGLHIPILDIPITEVDIVNLLMKARQVSNRIAVVGFGASIRATMAIRPMFDVDISVYPMRTTKDIPDMIQTLEQKDYTAIVGNPSVIEALERHGVFGFPITSQEDVIVMVLEEAAKLVLLLRSNTEWHLRQQAVINSIREQVFLLGPCGTVLNSNLPDVSPPLEDYPELREALAQNVTWSGAIVWNNQQYMCKSTPVSMEQNLGALVALENVNAKQTEIQRDSERRGFVPKANFSDVLHSTEIMRTFLLKAKQYSKSNASVLIHGESGTGKELIAQGIHSYSKRALGPFVSVNCAAIPEHLLESEFFGYQGGAFTGANRSGKRGLFELAHMGTLFLDEIGELPLLVQSKILRIIEENSFLRVGGDRLVHVDVRIVAATNRDLNTMVREKQFRDDLFFRLAVLRLEVPPLRQRKNDIPLLLKHFMNIISQQNSLTNPIVDEESYVFLQQYGFPGNVRELRSLAERLVVACQDMQISAEMLSAFLDFPQFLEKENVREGTLEKEECLLIQKTLAECHNNRRQAAKILGIAPSTLWRKCKHFGI